MSFSPTITDQVLIDCKRSCVICHKFCGTKIELHHIVPTSDGGDDSYENCIPLCFDCHSDVRAYDIKHPKGRKYNKSELIKHRKNWYNIVRSKQEPSELEIHSQALAKTFREVVRQGFVKRHGRAPLREEVGKIFAECIIDQGVDVVTLEEFEAFDKERHGQ